MIQSRLTPADFRIFEPMIGLTRCSQLQPIIVVSPKGVEFVFELHRRGYIRVATTANCGLPARQYDLALVDSRQRSIKALETTLGWLVNFLSCAGVLVVWVDPQNPAGNRNLHTALQRRGIVVKAGTVCKHGSAVSAQRQEVNPISKVA
jgi:hypothetical protein